MMIILKMREVMSKDERKNKIDEINKVEKEFREKQQTLQQELQSKQNSELNRIRVIVENAINEYAKDNDYDLILRADGTTLYAKTYVDITQEIIENLIKMNLGKVYSSSELESLLDAKCSINTDLKLDTISTLSHPVNGSLGFINKIGDFDTSKFKALIVDDSCSNDQFDNIALFRTKKCNEICFIIA